MEKYLNKIICSDCLEVMKGMPDKCVDLVLTSPPYDELRKYNGFSFDLTAISGEIPRILSDGGVMVWVCGDSTVNGSETGNSFRQALTFMERGLYLHDTMIYKKASCPFPETTRYYPSFEYMFIFSNGKPKTFNPIKDKRNIRYGDPVASSTQREADGRTRALSAKKTNPLKIIQEYSVRQNVWEYSPGYMKSTRDKIAYNHPAIFPEQLAKDHIISWSNEHDIVLDPFSGSGTTCKCAYLLNRQYIGIEISPEYCAIAEERIRQATRQERLFV